MSSSISITRLLSGVKKADEEAVCAFFARCYGRVAAIGRRKLVGKPQRAFDADDVANSAFREFLGRAAAGRFRKLENREDVWQILTLLVGDKISKYLRTGGAQKRGGGVPDVTIEHVQHAIRDLADVALEVQLADAKCVFLRTLPSDDHRRVFELLEEGHTQAEIAETLGVSLRSVARRLDVIRSILPRVLGITEPARTAQKVHEESHGADR